MTTQLTNKLTLAPSSELVAGVLGSQCASNEDMDKRFNEDPKKSFTSLFPEGCSLDEKVKVHSVRNTDGLVHVILPNHSILHDKEQMQTHIRDEDLAKVAGGEIITAIVASIMATVAVVGGASLATAATIIGAGTATAISVGVAGAITGGIIAGTVTAGTVVAGGVVAGSVAGGLAAAGKI